jgi:hypothetical protein
MMLVEDFKKDNQHKEIQENSAKMVEGLKELQENTAKHIEVLKEETQKFLKELEENTTKQVMEFNKTIQDLKRGVETTKKTQNEKTLEIETLGKKIRNHRCKHQQQNSSDQRENLRCRRFHKEHGHNNQRQNAKRS